MAKLSAVIFIFLIFALSDANIKISPTIVGGRNATLGQFPFVASYQHKALRGSHKCGAGIIHERWVLTAAHCLQNFGPDEVVVVVGTVRLDEGGVVHDVELILPHPYYVPVLPPFFISNWFDIGIVKTKTPIIFNEFTQPVQITPNFGLFGNMRGTVASFGAFFRNLTITPPPTEIVMSNQLQFMETRVLFHVECNYRTYLFNFLNPNYPVHHTIHPLTNICTLQPRGIGICFGDAGSMLMVGNEAVGVAVSGVRVCGHGAPDIYIRIGVFYGWIQNQISRYT